jgi:hypothetical protein
MAARFRFALQTPQRRDAGRVRGLSPKAEDSHALDLADEHMGRLIIRKISVRSFDCDFLGEGVEGEEEKAPRLMELEFF